MFAGIIGPEKAALFGFDDGVDAIGVCTGDGNADASEDPVWQSITFQTFPSNAVIFRAIETAAGSATGKKPGLATGLPKRGENDVWVMRIEHDVDAAGVFVFAQDLGPRFSSVVRSENSSVLVRAESVAERCDERDVRIMRVDD